MEIFDRLLPAVGPRVRTLILGMLVGSALGTTGCRSRRVEEAEAQRAPTQGVAALPAPAESDYEPNGDLKPSTERSFGLLLPRTMEKVASSERFASFGSHAPLAKVQKYFSARLFTGDVGRDDTGALFIRSATVRGSSSPVRVNVTIRSNSRFSAYVEISEDIPPERLPSPASEEEVKQNLRRYVEEGV